MREINKIKNKIQQRESRSQKLLLWNTSKIIKKTARFLSKRERSQGMKRMSNTDIAQIKKIREKHKQLHTNKF